MVQVHRDASELSKYKVLNFNIKVNNDTEVVYRGEKILGAGGNSVVVRGANCVEPKLALKVLDARAVHDETKRQLFQYETDLQQLLKHPNVVAFVGPGTTKLWNGKEAPVIAMPIYPTTVEQMINERGSPLPVDQTLKISIGTVSGLAYLHNTGNIVHRDIKPGNIFLDNSGRAVLGDLGTYADILTGRGPCDPSGDSFIIGTPNYIAPEYLRSESYTPQADIYSMGATMFRMCSGLDIYGEPGIQLSSYEIMRQKLMPASHVEKSLRKRGFSDIPEDLDTLILSMLEDDPRNRPESAEEVLKSAIEIFWKI